MTTVPAATTVTTVAAASRGAAHAVASSAGTDAPLPSPIARHAVPRDHVTARNFDHESLWSLFCRRLSFAMYRKTTRYHRQLVVAPVRGMADHILPVPLLADTIAVYLSSHLPMWMVARLGQTGLMRAARAVERALKLLGVCAKTIASPVLWLWRRLRTIKAGSHAQPDRAIVEARFLIDAPDGQNVNMLLDGRIMVGAVRFSPTAAYLSMRAMRSVRESVQIFAHAYPEDTSVLPENRRKQGFFCKDHDPFVEASRWGRKWYRDEIWLGDLPPGYYRIEVGIIEHGSFRKFPLSGTTRTSIDLGWTHVGPAEGAQ